MNMLVTCVLWPRRVRSSVPCGRPSALEHFHPYETPLLQTLSFIARTGLQQPILPAADLLSYTLTAVILRGEPFLHRDRPPEERHGQS